MDNPVIKVDRLSKNFRLPHEKSSTLKSAFLGMLQSTAHRTYERQRALSNVSFEVAQGEFFGVVGRNGSGKSTLLKILAQIYQPSGGSVHIQGRLVPFIELGVGFKPELTGRDNVYLNGALFGFSKSEMDGMYQDIVEFAELERFMDQKLKNYSSGMQVRLAFSIATRAKADILLVDEVLAVGDADFQRKCFDYFKGLKASKTTVVFVTHDMSAVREFCDRALLLEDSTITSIGSPAKVASEYSRLFIENLNQDSTDTSNQPGQRWGSGDAKVSDVSVQQVDDEIVVKVKAVANQPVDTLIYGLHIIAPDGGELMAMNNRMLQEPDIAGLAPGDKVEFEWRMLNVLSDGKYSISLTLVGSNRVTYDWYNNAGQFRVKKPQRSTTNILPPIKLSHKVRRS